MLWGPVGFKEASDLLQGKDARDCPVLMAKALGLKLCLGERREYLCTQYVFKCLGPKRNLNLG